MSENEKQSLDDLIAEIRALKAQVEEGSSRLEVLYMNDQENNGGKWSEATEVLARELNEMSFRCSMLWEEFKSRTYIEGLSDPDMKPAVIPNPDSTKQN